MQIPGLPTDNLYKFMALAGLAILGASGWYMVTSVDDLESELQAVEAAGAISRAKLDFLQEDADDLKGGPELSIEQWKLVRDRFREAKLETLTLEAQRKRFRWLLDRRKSLSTCLFASAIIGLALAASGFVLWYFRVQKYQDEALRQAAGSPPPSSPGEG